MESSLANPIKPNYMNNLSPINDFIKPLTPSFTDIRSFWRTGAQMLPGIIFLIRNGLVFDSNMLTFGLIGVVSIRLNALLGHFKNRYNDEQRPSFLTFGHRYIGILATSAFNAGWKYALADLRTNLVLKLFIDSSMGTFYSKVLDFSEQAENTNQTEKNIYVEHARELALDCAYRLLINLPGLLCCAFGANEYSDYVSKASNGVYFVFHDHFEEIEQRYIKIELYAKSNNTIESQADPDKKNNLESKYQKYGAMIIPSGIISAIIVGISQELAENLIMDEIIMKISPENALIMKIFSKSLINTTSSLLDIQFFLAEIPFKIYNYFTNESNLPSQNHNNNIEEPSMGL